MSTIAPPSPSIRSVRDAQYVGCWLTWVAATRGCLNFLGIQCNNADVAGQSGYAFRIVVREGLCPSGPTMFDWNSLLGGVWRLGRSTSLFFAGECHTGQWKNERTREHCRAAFESARREIDANRPCVIWGAYIPEFALCNGIEGENYLVDSYRKCINQPQPPVKFDELDAPGGLYTLGFPTAMETPRETADRGAIEHAVQVMSERFTDHDLASGVDAYDLWVDQLQQNKAVAFGNAYNAQCWAEARRLAERFVGGIAERNPAVPALREAHAAFKRSAEAMERVAKTFPFPGMPEHLNEPAPRTAAEALRMAQAADADALKVLQQSLVSWNRPKRSPGDA